MGHYRSEMINPDEDMQRERWEAERRKNVARGLSIDIEKRGVAAVLADIIMDDKMIWLLASRYERTGREAK